MIGGQLKSLAGPAFLSNAAANIYTPPAATIYTVIYHIHLVNITGSPATFSLFIGATGGSAAGTQLFGTTSLAAFTPFDYYCTRKMQSTDFLTGVANSASAIVIDVEGEQVVV
jgi:hypothetical protein